MLPIVLFVAREIGRAQPSSQHRPRPPARPGRKRTVRSAEPTVESAGRPPAPNRPRPGASPRSAKSA